MYVLDFLSFRICIRKFCICSFFEHWSNRLLMACKLSKMYKITFQHNNVIKMVTAIKNRLSRMFYAFIHKTTDSCSAFSVYYSDVLPTPAHLKGPVLRLEHNVSARNPGEQSHIGATSRPQRNYG